MCFKNELSPEFNQFDSFPEAICQLTKLTKLNLTGNQLSSLPDSIAQLTELTDLEIIIGNKLSALPKYKFGESYRLKLNAD